MQPVTYRQDKLLVSAALSLDVGIFLSLWMFDGGIASLGTRHGFILPVFTAFSFVYCLGCSIRVVGLAEAIAWEGDRLIVRTLWRTLSIRASDLHSVSVETKSVGAIRQSYLNFRSAGRLTSATVSFAFIDVPAADADRLAATIMDAARGRTGSGWSDPRRPAAQVPDQPPDRPASSDFDADEIIARHVANRHVAQSAPSQGSADQGTRVPGFGRRGLG